MVHPVLRRAAIAPLVVHFAWYSASALASPEGGYEVTRTQSVEQASTGWVGRKTTDRETRVGNTEDTDGNSRTSVLVVGGFVRDCPTADGIVEGNFEFSVTVDEVNTDVVPTERTHFAKRMTAALEGHVLNDGTVDYVDVDAQFVRGDGSAPQSVHTRFRPGAFGEPDFGALRADVERTGDLSIAVVEWFSGPHFREAQASWMRPNICVEFTFEAPSDTKSLGPNESAEVRVTLRSKNDQRPVSEAALLGNALQGIGRLTPQQGETPADAPFVVTYTASAEPKRGHGFDVAAKSRAGFATDKWRITDALRIYDLRFESTIVSRAPEQAAQSNATATVRLTGTEKVSPHYGPDPKRLYNGSGALSFVTTPLPGRDPCDPLISGQGTSRFTVVDTLIDIPTPEGAAAGLRPRIEMAYHIPLAGGETENIPFVLERKCVPGQSMPFPFWWSSYLSGRETDGDVNHIRDWTFVGRDGVVATKTFSGNCGGMCDEEISKLTLVEVQRAP